LSAFVRIRQITLSPALPQMSAMTERMLHLKVQREWMGHGHLLPILHCTVYRTTSNHPRILDIWQTTPALVHSASVTVITCCHIHSPTSIKEKQNEVCCLVLLR